MSVSAIRCSIATLLLIAPSFAQISPFGRSFTALDRHGLSFSVDYLADGFAGNGGQPRTASAHATSFLDLSATFDLSRMVPRWRAKGFASFHQTTHTTESSRGELQLVSNLDDVRRSVLAEFWMEQSVHRVARVRVGKIEANRDFAFVENGFDFLNASFSYSPTVISLPTYGNTRWGAELLIASKRYWTNLALFRSATGGVLPLVEVGLRWSPSGMNGRGAVGYWRDTVAIQCFSGLSRASTSGHYVVLEQALWKRPQTAQSLSGFLQYGTVPEDVSSIARHFGMGILWNSPMRRRENDAAGLAVSLGRLSRDPYAALEHHAETVYEVFYQIQLRQKVSVTPDVQYIDHPGGMAGWPNALVFGARVKFSFSTHHEE
jgi:porin